MADFRAADATPRWSRIIQPLLATPPFDELPAGLDPRQTPAKAWRATGFHW
ncbi:hypothetical protein SAMN05216174_1288 [Actinokineospora iranica]|uniref:Uncharacterized protein n=1 Tax=Actinokineospora iranica TaxID=1271860 RepID=A0A1G6ZD54_9PSEU|nr:hypothetical protein SAMN05216174_1288 [Actinokineospora iranica]